MYKQKNLSEIFLSLINEKDKEKRLKTTLSLSRGRIAFEPEQKKLEQGHMGNESDVETIALEIKRVKFKKIDKSIFSLELDFSKKDEGSLNISTSSRGKTITIEYNNEDYYLEGEVKTPPRLEVLESRG